MEMEIIVKPYNSNTRNLNNISFKLMDGRWCALEWTQAVWHMEGGLLHGKLEHVRTKDPDVPVEQILSACRISTDFFSLVVKVHMKGEGLDASIPDARFQEMAGCLHEGRGIWEATFCNSTGSVDKARFTLEGDEKAASLYWMWAGICQREGIPLDSIMNIKEDIL